MKKVAMRWFALFLMMLLPVGASAQAASAPVVVVACTPTNFLLKGTGTDYITVETADVKGRMGWCPNPDGSHRIAIFQWNLKRLSLPANFDEGAAFDRIRAASSPFDQFTLEAKTLEKPLANDLEKWQYKEWRHVACQKLTSTEPGVTPRPPLPVVPASGPWKNADGTNWMPALTHCDVWAPGPKPVPVVTDIWKANGTIIFLTASGRISNATVRKATVGALCNCTSKILLGLKTYCPLAAGLTNEVTECLKQP